MAILTNQYGQTYSGNDDFRGWLAANPDLEFAGSPSTSMTASSLLGFVGNDGKVDTTKTGPAPAEGEPGNYWTLTQGAANDAYDKWVAARQGSGQYAGTDSDAQAKADEAAYWGDQINALNRLLGSTATQKDQGLTRIEDTYNTNVNRTKEKEAQGLAGYATSREDTTRDKMRAFGDIDTKARTGYEALQRVLGLGNASVSSAARIVAPTAVSREATQQRTRATDTFGRNLRDIDTKENDFKLQVAQALEDLLGQKKSTTEDFLRSILGQEMSLQEQLSNATTQQKIAQGGSYRSATDARAPFQSRVGAIQNELDSLFNTYRTPAIAARDVKAGAPDLAQYLVDPIKVAAAQANPLIDQSLLPYLANIRQKDQDQLV